jgi:hypothetical protein
MSNDTYAPISSPLLISLVIFVKEACHKFVHGKKYNEDFVIVFKVMSGNHCDI